MIGLEVLVSQIWTDLLRSITGQLFTKDQISQITSHAAGKYFADLFPKPALETKARERVEEARQHIIEANAIISEMQVDLESQHAQLDSLLEDIEEKKRLAEKYAQLAETNEANFAALKEEMSNALREELLQQSEQGKTLRRVSSALIWIVTLLIGAALGTYFKNIVEWLKVIIA
ncbi:MAG: hypothetical protein KZQ90_18560 [Candidatus Thiodiazotropha sp. (ex Codakia rugifera)]|nr:hypothetical protein [Candidatus Thiodiazotropha sp. (ex Codakia rugifera)]